MLNSHAQSRRRRQREAIGMTRFMSAFLSCDARDMCCIGPAFVRVVLTWMAVGLRLVTLWAFLVVDLDGLAQFYSAVHWGMRLEDPAYREFTSLRDEAHRTRDRWIRGDTSDALAREDALRITATLRRWRERTTGIDPFIVEYEYTEAPGCPAFRSVDGLVEVLEAQEWEERFQEYLCEYLVLFE